MKAIIRDSADHDEHDADPQICPLILHEARSDALVDDVALLEEQLPRRDRRADDGDDEQHDVAELSVLRQLRHDEIAGDVGVRRMHHEEDRHQHEAAKDEHHGEALETAEIAGRDGTHDEGSRNRDADRLRQPEIVERERNADEFGDDRQRVEKEEIDHREGAPEAAETGENQPCMTDAGHRAETQHHFLVHIKNRNEKDQRPKERRAVVLAGLRIGTKSAGVIVADHHDEAGSEDGHQRAKLVAPGRARTGIVLVDRAEGAVDVADMCFVEHGGSSGFLEVCSHMYLLPGLPAGGTHHHLWRGRPMLGPAVIKRGLSGSVSPANAGVPALASLEGPSFIGVDCSLEESAIAGGCRHHIGT